MLERDDHARREGLGPFQADATRDADETETAGAEEPINADFADSGADQANNIRTYLENVEPIFQAELADVSPDVSPEPPPQVRRRRVILPIVLFLLTCLSTFVAGACMWWPADYVLSPPFAQDVGGGPLDSPLRRALLTNWNDGLIYMVCVLAILFTHEMGHFLATIRYKIPASLPFFLPFPLAPLGTLGAVIGMDGRRANRKETFDIGIAGPLAGLVVALPVLWIGVNSLDMSSPAHGMFQVEPPLIAKWMLALRQPEGYTQGDMIWQSQLNPCLMAGWFGLIITGLNMMPVSQLDGGHVIYTLFGRRARWIARGFIVLTVAAMALDWVYRGLFLMVIMILLIGIDHPPTNDDSVRLGRFRTGLGYVSLAIPFLCFAPRLFHAF
ncbi:MAG TPA: site-2 protease family protein [Pirellulaceae bacterium]|jgi:Zn-dependent protease|nr:site-2 protease family protein [Pirellulaceae bacterium]